MDIWGHLPRSIAHSWIKNRKEKSGLNRARALRLDERRRGKREVELVRSKFEMKLSVTAKELREERSNQERLVAEGIRQYKEEAGSLVRELADTYKQNRGELILGNLKHVSTNELLEVLPESYLFGKVLEAVAPSMKELRLSPLRIYSGGKVVWESGAFSRTCTLSEGELARKIDAANENAGENINYNVALESYNLKIKSVGSDNYLMAIHAVPKRDARKSKLLKRLGEEADLVIGDIADAIHNLKMQHGGAYATE